MSTPPKICVEPTPEKAIELATGLVKTIICEANDRRHACCLSLAGGTTPQRLYQQLARVGAEDDVPWGVVEVFFGDERDVPLDDVESNYHMAQRALLDHVPIEPTHVHPMRGDAEDLAAAAAEYEQLIRQVVPAGPDGRPRFDLILLGMGSDGHAASLFPDTPALEEADKLVTTQFVPVLGRHRLTLTLPLINAARNIILFVMGDDKADTVATLLGDDSSARRRLPAARIRPTDGNLMVILDAAAGRRIRS